MTKPFLTFDIIFLEYFLIRFYFNTFVKKNTKFSSKNIHNSFSFFYVSTHLIHLKLSQSTQICLD